VSAVWRRRSGTLLTFTLLAALAVAARLPFLLRSDRFFDSDEAVEGLMALHVLRGEFPAVLWGQDYKGVPEVYLAAAFFAIAGPSVAALKAATLACFVVLLWVQFTLLTRLFSRRVAWAASLLLVAGPPSLVAWSLSANAEIILTMLAGGVLLLAWDRWNADGSRRWLALAAMAAGFGLWVHQYIVYYLVALALATWWAQPKRWEAICVFVRAADASPSARWWMRAFLAASALYVALGAVAFADAGFDIGVGGRTIGVHHPQKMWRIAAGLALLGIGGRWISRSGLGRVDIGSAAVAFLVGYSPALIHGGAAPVAETTATGVLDALAPIADTVVPIVFGYKAPFTERLAVPGWTALLLVAALVVAYLGVRHRTAAFFRIYLVSTLLLFLLSGSYIDAQSYRYLMPLHAALPVLYALAAERVSKASAIAGVLLTGALVGLFSWQQIAWYRTLAPDVTARTALRCARERGITHARADYWLSYKLTFLSGERLIVAPLNGLDRYPRYSSQVREAEPVAILRSAGAGPVSCDSVVE
jgi:hypothetical protein